MLNSGKTGLSENAPAGYRAGTRKQSRTPAATAPPCSAEVAARALVPRRRWHGGVSQSRIDNAGRASTRVSTRQARVPAPHACATCLRHGEWPVIVSEPARHDTRSYSRSIRRRWTQLYREKAASASQRRPASRLGSGYAPAALSPASSPACSASSAPAEPAARAAAMTRVASAAWSAGTCRR